MLTGFTGKSVEKPRRDVRGGLEVAQQRSDKMTTLRRRGRVFVLLSKCEAQLGEGMAVDWTVDSRPAWRRVGQPAGGKPAA